VACYLLHVSNDRNQRPYDDPDVKDVVGFMPQFFCTNCLSHQATSPERGREVHAA